MVVNNVQWQLVYNHKMIDVKAIEMLSNEQNDIE